MTFNRTHTSTGSTKKFTYSCWIKQSDVDASNNNYLFSVSDDDGAHYDESRLLFQSTTPTQLQYVASDISVNVMANSQEKDPTGWKHVMVVVDTTLDASLDRVKLYVNGVRKNELFTTTMPAKNANLAHNFSGNILVIGGYGNQFIFNGGLLDVYNVDGQALTPDVFGFYKDGDGYISAGTTQATDFRPGQWVPKKPSVIKNSINNSGGFGVNGFYLPMNDSSNFGADFHTTPNSIIKLQEDLPQPRVSIDSSTNAAGLAYTDVLRNDPYADFLILAVPGVGTVTDYSNYINTSGTAGAGMTATTFGGAAAGVGTFSVYYGESINTGLGTTSRVAYEPQTSITYGDEWTLETWVRNDFEPSPGAWRTLIHQANPTSWSEGIVLSRHGTGNSWSIWQSGGGLGGQLLQAGTGSTSITDEWIHIAADRKDNLCWLYQNGVPVGVSTNIQTPSSCSPTTDICIGGEATTNSFHYPGYFQDTRIYNGVAKYQGKGFDCPKPYTPVGIGTWRAAPDTTANNFATLNPVSGVNKPNITFSNGNLTIAKASASTNEGVFGSIGVSTGKWYYEMRLNSFSAGSDIAVGIAKTEDAPSAFGARSNESLTYLVQSTGDFNGIDGASVNYGDAFAVGDVLGVALDLSDFELTFFRNGVSQGIATEGVAGFAASTGDIWRPYQLGDSANNQYNLTWNFGQNPSFSGVTTFGTETDDNGRGLFKFPPPAGYLAMCEDNLPTPAIKNPGDYFKTVLYIGDSNEGRSITGIGFTPDLVWIKHRNNAGGHGLYDSVRGPGLRIDIQSTAAQSTARGVLGFESDGFSLGSTFNTSDITAVAWCWQAGAGTTSTNTDGALPSVVSVNQEAGFSIVQYTGDGSSTTIGHGLGKRPDFRIYITTDIAANRYVWHKSFTADEFAILNQAVASTTGSNLWNNTLPTDTTISLGPSSQDQIEYVWTEIEGFSKFGSYTGNGSADGPFAYCGFKPAFVMVKRTSDTGSWYMFDSSRESDNPVEKYLLANNSNIEADDLDYDFLSNGFKVRNSYAEINNSGDTFIFAAFAESPFKTANAQ